MKSIEQRARELLFALRYTNNSEEDLERIIESLKDQDKITKVICLDKIDAIKINFLDVCYPENNNTNLRSIIKREILKE